MNSILNQKKAFKSKIQKKKKRLCDNLAIHVVSKFNTNGMKAVDGSWSDINNITMRDSSLSQWQMAKISVSPV